jgi:hypothetical protein
MPASSLRRGLAPRFFGGGSAPVRQPGQAGRGSRVALQQPREFGPSFQAQLASALLQLSIQQAQLEDIKRQKDVAVQLVNELQAAALNEETPTLTTSPGTPILLRVAAIERFHPVRSLEIELD